MLFSLEVLQAKHGDCLILHLGDKNSPRIVVIDGGPDGVYNSFLKPRLTEIKTALTPQGNQPIELLMVSHLDDDHVNGVLAFAEDVDDGTMPFNIKNLWLNTFDDIIGNIQIPVVSSLPASASAASVGKLNLPAKTPERYSAVIASVPQGRSLRDIAIKNSWTTNSPFKATGQLAKLVRGDKKQPPIPVGNLKVTVVHPNEKRLLKLQAEWDKKLKEAKKKGDDKVITAALVRPDTSVYNLSSIVCMVEAGGKRMLLTGDALSTDTYDGLKENGFLKNGKLHVDILKMPHHGSIRNVTKEFLEKITADHYVISANGRDDNPDKATLDLFAKVVKKGTLHLTNKTGSKELGPKVTAFLKKLKTAKSQLKVEFLSGKPIMLDLEDKVTY